MNSERRKKAIRVGGVVVLVIFALLGLGLAFIATTWRPPSQDESFEDSKNREIPIIQDVPRDAIPPLDSPRYETATEANWLKDNDIVLGVEFDGDARAYSIKILNWHEIVNESIGGKDIVVTYCPLCRSGIVFDRHLEGRLLIFGNTGALYESDMVMYDRETESYWFQVAGRAIKGPLKGKELSVLPSYLATWKEWRKLHPATLTLSRNTGFRRNYDSDPYRGYDAPNSKPAFPVSIFDDRLPPKEKVIGILVNGVAKAYPVKLAQGKILKDEIAGQRIEIVGDEEGISARIFYVSADIREPAPQVFTFWFAWFAAHPSTLIFNI